MTPDTLIVVPMKEPHLAKTRLQGVLDGGERARLARQLFERTLRLLITLRDSKAPAYDLAIVTRDPVIRARAETLGIRVIAERDRAGLNEAIAAAARVARTAGYDRLCVLPADLATPDPQDIRVLLSQDLGQRGVALCPSRDFGTNALLAAPPDAIPFAYGEQSFHAHRKNAESVGITPLVLPLESLRWDIDSSADLAELASVAPDILGKDG